MSDVTSTSFSNENDEQLAQPTSVPPWSANATFWLAVLLILLYLVLTMINLGIGVGIELAAQGLSEAEMEGVAESVGQQLALDGDFNWANYIIGTLIFMPILFVFAKKGQSTTAKAYLGFDTLPTKKDFINFNLLLVGYFIFAYAVSYIFEIETPASMIEMYQSTDRFYLLIIAVIFCAPLLEETFFRGFLFKGWQHSKLGTTGTIILTSILFVLIHGGQYELSVLVTLSVLALLLGIARHKSGGIWLPIYLHLVNNAFSTVEMYLLMK